MNRGIRLPIVWNALWLVILSAGVAEIGARTIGARLLPPKRSLDSLPGMEVPGEPNMVVDAASGWRPRTGEQASFGIPGGTSVNSNGMRGPEITRRKPTGERRILILGDSNVFGVLVADADIFPRRLEASLEVIDPQIHVLNGGAPGWSSWQALRATETRFVAYKPDLVVVASLWSDVQGADQADRVRFSAFHLGMEHSSAFVIVREWARYVRLAPEETDTQVGRRPPGSGPGANVGRGANAPGVTAASPRADGNNGVGNNGGNKSPIIGKGGAPTVRVSLDEYRANLTALTTLSRNAGGDAAFLVLPHIRDVGGGTIGDFRDDYRTAMRDTAATLHVPIADAPAAFVGANAGAMFLDEVHPSAAGHARIAAVLTETLSEWAKHPK